MITRTIIILTIIIIIIIPVALDHPQCPATPEDLVLVTRK
jgi:hypothetical protein